MDKLGERLIGALTFRTQVYEDVEKDPTFTQTAWIIVAITGFLNQLGSRGNLISALIGTIFAVVGFYALTWVVSWVGQKLFNATVTPDELFRTLGLANIWSAFGVLGFFLGGLGVTIAFIAGLVGLAAMFVAAKSALDLDWAQTIVCVIIGWLVLFAILFVAGLVLSALGLAVGAVTSA
jgi:hypothetical protein